MTSLFFVPESLPLMREVSKIFDFLTEGEKNSVSPPVTACAAPAPSSEGALGVRMDSLQRPFFEGC